MMGAGDAASRRRGEYSEKDVLEVLRLMKAAYNVDDSRIYLIGHSMGAIGTWALGSKYPQTWAAIVAFSGVGVADARRKHESAFRSSSSMATPTTRSTCPDRATWWLRSRS